MVVVVGALVSVCALSLCSVVGGESLLVLDDVCVGCGCGGNEIVAPIV